MKPKPKGIKKEWLHWAAAVVFFGVAIIGIATSVQMNLVNRSFWLDEAMLSYSFSQRDIGTLWNGAFEWDQTAPLGWLYFEKLLTVIFGNTEFVVRMGSVMAYAATVCLIFFTLYSCFDAPVFIGAGAAAFYANIPFVLQYSNVFKQYCSEGFFILLAVFVFCMYKKKRIKAWVWMLSWTVMIWFANPVCFIEGGLIIGESIHIVRARKWKTLKPIVDTTLCIAASFIIYYFFWLKVTATSSYMQNYWSGSNFPLFEAGAESVKKAENMISEIFRHFAPFPAMMVILTVFSICMLGLREKHIGTGLTVGLLIACFASSINMFPVEDRLWFFIYPYLTFIVFLGLNEIASEDSFAGFAFLCVIIGCFVMTVWNSILFGLMIAIVIPLAMYVVGPVETSGIAWLKRMRKWLLIALTVILVFSLPGIQFYFNHPQNVYWAGEELNNEIQYVEENIKDDEMLYVYHHSVPGYQYKMGYDNHSIGHGYENNVIYGETFFNDDIDCEAEIDKIFSNDKIYIMTSHIRDDRLAKLLTAAHAEGSFELVLFEHETPLWYWCRNKEDTRIHVSCESVSTEKTEGKTVYTIKLKNDGNAYLNHKYETVKALLSEQGEGVEIPKNVEPGSVTGIRIETEEPLPHSLFLSNEFGIIQEIPLESRG